MGMKSRNTEVRSSGTSKLVAVGVDLGCGSEQLVNNRQIWVSGRRGGEYLARQWQPGSSKPVVRYKLVLGLDTPATMDSLSWSSAIRSLFAHYLLMEQATLCGGSRCLSLAGGWEPAPIH